jgi:hypothetical protein
MPGTTVAQKFNQGIPRLYKVERGIKLRVAFLGTLVPAPPMRGPHKKVQKQKRSFN